MSVMNGNAATEFQRLPKFAVPSHYELHIKPCLESFLFSGIAAVTLEVNAETNYLLLNASGGLKITSAKLVSGTCTIDGITVDYDDQWQTAKLNLPQVAKPGAYTLRMDFTGELRDNLKGFYRSSFKDSQGQTRWMASTQFESIDARCAFPCWDEPALKATFDIELTVPADKTALANTPVADTEQLGDKLMRVRFTTTPKMSTYLVGFAVGDFEHVEARTTNNVLVRVYAVPGKSHLCQFALEVATKILPYFAEFFASPYPLEKCDLVAIPDFEMGAMENWGLLTYRESRLLFDPKVSTASTKESIGMTVVHEIAHSWFGNLVTMEWWTDLWLKEGFARFLQYFGMDVLYPEMDMWTTYTRVQTQMAMLLDCLRNSHPIEVPINNPEELPGIYDAISYSKGSCVIRMLYTFLGEEKFLAGLRSYMKKYAYKNTVTKDLWNELSAASGIDVGTMMNNWTARMGFPVVRAKITHEGPKRKLNLTQRWFLADPLDSPEEMDTGDFPVIWHIPITVSTSSEPKKISKRFLLKDSEGSFELEDVASASKWIKLNFESTGYYRIQYDEADFRHLLDPYCTKVLSARDRLNLVADTFALVKTTDVPVKWFLDLLDSSKDETEYSVWSQLDDVKTTDVPVKWFLDLLDSSKDETEYSVWSQLDSGVASLCNVLQHMPDALARFNAFLRSVYAKAATSVGYCRKDGESHHMSKLRPIVVGRMASAGDDATSNELLRQFDAFVDGSLKLDPDLREKVFNNVVMYRGLSAVDKLMEEYFKEGNLPDVKSDTLCAVGRSRDPVVISRCLDMACAKDSKIKLQDKYYPFVGATATMEGQELTWQYIRKDFEGMLKTWFPEGYKASPIVQLSLKQALSSMSCYDKAREVESYFAPITAKNSSLVKPVAQSVEKIKCNARLREQTVNVVGWLEQHGF